MVEYSGKHFDFLNYFVIFYYKQSIRFTGQKEETRDTDMTPKKQVMVVEDNWLNREMLVSILEQQYDVLQAENGQEALELLEQHREDVAVILLDVMMPVLLEVARKRTICPRCAWTAHTGLRFRKKVLIDGC